MAPEQYQRHIAIFWSPMARITRLLQWKEAPAHGSCLVRISPAHSVACILVKGCFQRDWYLQSRCATLVSSALLLESSGENN